MPERHKAHTAAFQGNTVALAEALENDYPKLEKSEGATPFHCAAACVDTDPQGVLNQLIDNGADPNATTASGVTPLHVAACVGNTRFVSALLDRVGDELHVNVKMVDSGFTPLHIASASTAGEATTERLAAAGALVSVKGAHGLLPIHVAANVGMPGTIAALIQRGASATATMEGGLNAIHMAACTANPTIARVAVKVCVCIDWLGPVQVNPPLMQTLVEAYDVHLLDKIETPSTSSILTTVREIAERQAVVPTGGGVELVGERGRRKSSDVKSMPAEAGAKPKKNFMKSFMSKMKTAISKDAEPPPPDRAPPVKAPMTRATSLQSPMDKQDRNRFADCVDMLAKHGCPIDGRTDEGVTPLMMAAQRADVPLVRKLLQLNADVTATDTNERDAMSWCCQSSSHLSAAALTTLRVVGLQINSHDSLLRSPLHYACQYGNLGLVKELLLGDANPNAQDANLRTPLWDAVDRSLGGESVHAQRRDIVKLLINKGARIDPSEKDINGVELLMHAVSDGDHPSAAIIMSHARSHGMLPSVSDKTWYQVAKRAKDSSPLLQELPTDHQVALIALESAWRSAAKTSRSDHFFQSENPDFEAAADSLRRQSTDSSYTAALLQRVCHGQCVSKVTDEGDTVLHLAVRYAHAPEVSLLLRCNASVKAANNKGFTPLHELLAKYVAEPGIDQVVSAMLVRGSNASMPDGNGVPPLHHAARCGNTAVSKLLINAGSSAAAVDSDGRNALHVLIAGCIARLGHIRMAGGLAPTGRAAPRQSHEARRQTADSVTVFERPKFTSVLAAAAQNERGSQTYSRRSTTDKLPPSRLTAAQPNRTTFFQQLKAASSAYIELMQVLSDRGTDMNQQDNNGDTPMHVAAAGASKELINAMIALGASTVTPNATGITPLHVAAMHCQPAVVDTLVSAGAEVEAPDRNLRTPLHFACFFGSAAVVEGLVRHHAQVDVVDHHRRTPLHVVCTRELADDSIDSHMENLACARALIRHNAKPDTMDERLRSPMLLAYIHGHVHLAHYLWAKGANPATEYGTNTAMFQHALRVADTRLIKTLLSSSRSLEVHHKTSEGVTFLECLCSYIRNIAFMPYAACMDELIALRVAVTLHALADLWSHICEACTDLRWLPEDTDTPDLPGLVIPQSVLVRGAGESGLTGGALASFDRGSPSAFAGVPDDNLAVPGGGMLGINAIRGSSFGATYRVASAGTNGLETVSEIDDTSPRESPTCSPPRGNQPFSPSNLYSIPSVNHRDDVPDISDLPKHASDPATQNLPSDSPTLPTVKSPSSPPSAPENSSSVLNTMANAPVLPLTNLSETDVSADPNPTSFEAYKSQRAGQSAPQEYTHRRSLSAGSTSLMPQENAGEQLSRRSFDSQATVLVPLDLQAQGVSTPAGFQAMEWNPSVGEMLARKRCPFMPRQMKIASVRGALHASSFLLSLWKSQSDIATARLPTGESALHIAVRCRMWVAVEELLGEGADAYATDESDQTPLDHLLLVCSKRTAKYRLVPDPDRAMQEDWPVASKSTREKVADVKAAKMYLSAGEQSRVIIDKFLACYH